MRRVTCVVIIVVVIIIIIIIIIIITTTTTTTITTTTASHPSQHVQPPSLDSRMRRMRLYASVTHIFNPKP